MDSVTVSHGPSTENPIAPAKTVGGAAEVLQTKKTKRVARDSLNRGVKTSKLKRRRLNRKEDQESDSSDDESAGMWKHVKLDKFPSGIAASRKLESWYDWHRRFRIITKNMKKISQSKKAELLYIMIGDEIQRIINVKGLLLENPQEGYKSAYDDLVYGIETYFKSLADPTVNLMAFNTMKQEVGEGARDFQIRVMRQAELCAVGSNQAMLKERFARGLLNQKLAELAYVNDWSMEDTAAAAARKEAWEVSAKQSSSEQPKLIAAVGSSGPRFSGGYRGEGVQRQQHSNPGRKDKGEDTAKSPPCKNCGIVCCLFVC